MSSFKKYIKKQKKNNNNNYNYKIIEENNKLEEDNKKLIQKNRILQQIINNNFNNNNNDSIKQYKIALFSYNFGNYRNELNINLDSPNIYFDKDIDYYFFTDNKKITSNKWKIINNYPKLNGNNIMNSNRWTYKYLRFHTPDILKDYDIIISVDSKPHLLNNIDFKSNFINKFFTENDYKILLRKHPQRNNIKQELIKTIQLNYENKKKAIKFLKKIEDIKINIPLIELAFFIRRNDKETNDFFEYVYSLFIQTGLKRDQNFFTYAIHNKNFQKYIKITKIQNIKYFANPFAISYEEKKNGNN